jgi:hypothetical protein
MKIVPSKCLKYREIRGNHSFLELDSNVLPQYDKGQEKFSPYLHSYLNYWTQLKSAEKNILSRVPVTKTRFGLVIGFIDHLQDVSTINYYTLAALHNLHSTLISSGYLH